MLPTVGEVLGSGGPVSAAGTPATAALNLAPEAISAHWRNQGVADIIGGMEACEPWAVDGHPRAEQIVKELAERLSATDSANVTLSVVTSPREAVELMAYLHSGRALRFLSWLAEINPTLPGYLLSLSKDSGDEFAVLLLDRIQVFERQRLLSRIFSPERLALVIEALECEGFAAMDEENL